MHLLLIVVSVTLAYGQLSNSNSPPRRVPQDGTILYNQILQAAAAANNRAYAASMKPHPTNETNTHPTNNEYFASVLRHFEQLYNASQLIKKMNQLTDLEDQYLRAKLSTQIDSQFLNRTMFTTNYFPECVAQLKNKTRVIVDKANAAMQQCQSLFNEEDEVVTAGIKFQLMSKLDYERFRDCTLNSSDGSMVQGSLMVDCVNITMHERDVALMPIMRFSRCWRDIIEGAGEIERLLRLVFAQTDNCIAQVSLRQEQGNSGVHGTVAVHNRQRRWRTFE